MMQVSQCRDWVQEDDISAARLQNYLRTIMIEAEIDDEGYLYLKKGLDHPVWIFIDQPHKLIQLIAHAPLLVDDGQHAVRVNKLNQTYIGVQFHTLYEALWGNAWLSYKTGMTLRHLAHMTSLFASAFLHAINEPCIRDYVQDVPSGPKH